VRRPHTSAFRQIDAFAEADGTIWRGRRLDELSRAQVCSQPHSVGMTLRGRRESRERGTAAEIVTRVARRHARVVVPDVLAAGGLVVLARRDAVTGVDVLERDGHLAGNIVDGVAILRRNAAF
jgi:hypothetical protein